MEAKRRESGTAPGHVIVGFFSTLATAVLALSHSLVLPSTAFRTPSSSLGGSSAVVEARSSRWTSVARRHSTALSGIKKKVKVELEENFSGKVVEPPSPMASMMGGDPQALLDVIEKNKRRAAEAGGTQAPGNAAAEASDDEEEEDSDGNDAGPDDGEA